MSESQSSLWSRATRTRGRRIALATAAAFTAVGLAVGGAAAVSTTQSAGSVTAQQYATNSDATYVGTVGNSWTNVPGTYVSVTIPSGTSRVIDARYTAESQCLGTGYCSARVVYQKSGGSITEMRPVAGTDFAFDSSGGDVRGSWESHAMERSTVRLGAGTYRVWVQGSKSAAAVSEFRLDEQHLVVSLNS